MGEWTTRAVAARDEVWALLDEKLPANKVESVRHAGTGDAFGGFEPIVIVSLSPASLAEAATHISQIQKLTRHMPVRVAVTMPTSGAADAAPLWKEMFVPDV